MFCRSQEGGEDVPEPVVERKLSDEIQKLANIKASSKIRSDSTPACKHSPPCMRYQVLMAMFFSSADQWTALWLLMER